jgi:hypothetical protein
MKNTTAGALSNVDRRGQMLPGVRGKDRTSRAAAALALIGFSTWVGVVVLLHGLQSDLDPLVHFMSEYAVREGGWLMKVAFFFFAAGQAGLVAALLSGVPRPARSGTGVILLAISCLGILGAGTFDTVLLGSPITQEGALHGLSSVLTFFTAVPGMIVVSRRLRSAGRLHGKYRVLPGLGGLVLVLLLAFAFGFPIEPAGLAQRLFITAMFAWLLLCAGGLWSGAFESGPVQDVEPQRGAV